MSFIAALLLPMAFAAPLRLAFIEGRSSNGDLVRLEPGGRYFHLAMEVDGGWLHAHPRRGVEVVSQNTLAEVGRVVEVIAIEGRQRPGKESYHRYLGRPYDPAYGWGDEALYCSELIAKVLGIEPTPMTFDPTIWGKAWKSRRGEPGISPDEIRTAITQKSFQSAPSCSTVFTSK